MNTRGILIALLLIGVSACAENQHGITTDPRGATTFIVENPARFPSTNICERGDIDYACDGDRRPFEYELLGKPLPNINANFLDGTPFSMKMLDRWTVIHVWGVWCGDSRADAAFTAQLSDALSEEADLAFLSIHVPISATRTSDKELFGKYGSVSGFLEEKGYSYPTLIDTDASIREALRLSWTPSYLVVSPDGYVRGYRTDLSVSGDAPVEHFLGQIKQLKAAVGSAFNRREEPTLTIGPEGALKLTDTSVFTAPAMEAAFPNFIIVADRSGPEDESYPVYHIREPIDAADAPPVYTVTPTWTRGHVGTVSTRHPSVIGPNGLRIQKTRLDELSEDQRARCYSDSDAPSPLYSCTDTVERPNFVAIFGPDTPRDSNIEAESDENDGNYILIEMKFMPETPIDAR